MASPRPVPRRTDLLNPPEGYEWVSCSPREFPSVGWAIHLIRTTARRQQWQTTRCGATASLPGIWRRPAPNSPKPLCTACTAENGRRQP